MRHLTITLLTIALLGFANCDKESDLITVNLALSIHEQVNDSGSRVAAEVPDFAQRFGDVDLIVTNPATNTQVIKSATGDYVKHIELPEGTYDFYMASDGDQVWNDHLKFSAALNAVAVTNGSTITLPTETEQALVLFVKAGLDAAPTIEVRDNAATYGVVTMYDEVTYYWMYVYGGWSYRIDYSVGGNAGELYRQFEAKKIYRYTISGNNLVIEDAFNEILDNY